MLDFLTREQILWIREHAMLMSVLTIALAALFLWLIYRWLRRKHPNVADAIDGAARDYWAGMGIHY